MAQISEPVKVEIDLEADGFVEVFDNIRFGFDDLNKKVTKLWVAVGLLSMSTLGLTLSQIF